MTRKAFTLRVCAALLLAPAAAFCAASALGLSKPLNRLVTPNHDGYNDTFIFRAFNPSDKAIDAKIYNLSGMEIAVMTLKQRSTGVVPVQYAYGEYYDLEWDPNAGSRKPGGVYIYQIRLGTSVYKGTVTVIR